MNQKPKVAFSVIPLNLNEDAKLPDTVNSKKASVNAQAPANLQKTVLCRKCE